MIFRSPHPDLLVPTHRSVPSLLLSPTDHRTSRPILYPTPAADTARPEAKPLSIAHVRSLAYAFAAALLTGALGGREWKKGDLLVIYAQNQVSPSHLVRQPVRSPT